MYPHVTPKRAVGIILAAAALTLCGIVAVVGSLRAEVAELEAANANLATEYRSMLRADEALLDAYAAKYWELEAENAALREANADLAKQLRAEKARQSAPRAVSRPNARSVAPAPATSGRGCLTRSEVVAHLSRGCEQYGISGEERAWVIAAGVRVAWGESRFNPSARNGDHVGIAQMDSGWGSESQRLDPAWSLRRFVKAYKEGGRENIERHWAATL